MPKHRKHQKMKPIQAKPNKPIEKPIVQKVVVPWKDCFDGAVKFCLLFIVGMFVFMALVYLLSPYTSKQWSSDYVKVIGVEQMGDNTLLTFDDSIRYTPPTLLDSSEVEGVQVGDWVVVWMLKRGFGKEKVVTVEEL